MKTELIQSLTDTFKGHAQRSEQGVEFRLARDLQHLLGYAEWRNFGTVLSKAKTVCEVSGHPVADHFVDVNKMVDIGSGTQRDIDDIMLTRYACYLNERRKTLLIADDPTRTETSSSSLTSTKCSMTFAKKVEAEFNKMIEEVLA